MQALLVSTVAVALAEIGDKTQLLALVLAVRFRRPWPIIAGILIATLANHNVPVVYAGHLSARRIPRRLIHGVAAAVFVIIGLLVLIAGHATG